MNDLNRLLELIDEEREIRAEIAKGEKTDVYFKPKLEHIQRERDEICKQNNKNILALSPSEYRIFKLRYIQGKSHRAIAKKLNYSLSTITHKIASINKKLGT